MYIRRRNAFTLIEMIFALALFTILGFAGISLLIYTSQTSERIAFQNELLENARITLSFIVEQIRISERYELTTDSTNSLIELVCYPDSEERVFAFDKHLSPNDSRYGQVLFGRNELASYIADVEIKVDGTRMEIRITTHSKPDEHSSIQIQPIELVQKISVRHKE